MGIVIGFVASLSVVAFASGVKQYILIEAPYPIFVNGVEYKDPERPILNYEGSTYVPLAKLGDLTGVSYRWNEQLQRVEISTGPTQFYSDYNGDILNFAYVNGTQAGERFVMSDGKTIVYVYDVAVATNENIERFAKALESQGYQYEWDTSSTTVSFFSKGKIVVGFTIMIFDDGFSEFQVIITTD